MWNAVSSGIWTRVAVSISSDDNHYTIGFMPFTRLLEICEMLTVTSRNWIRVIVVICYDYDHYTRSDNIQLPYLNETKSNAEFFFFYFYFILSFFVISIIFFLNWLFRSDQPCEKCQQIEHRNIPSMDWYHSGMSDRKWKVWGKWFLQYVQLSRSRCRRYSSLLLHKRLPVGPGVLGWRTQQSTSGRKSVQSVA